MTHLRKAAIDFDAVEFAYNNAFRLGPLKHSIAEGTITVILGPSGSGKSTVLRLIARLLKPTSGEMKIPKADAQNRPKPMFSMVFQDYVLYPHLSVEENAILPFQVGSIARRERQKLASELGREFGIFQYLERMPDELSGGERQRAALLKTLVSGAPIWLMDEPLSNLDPHLRLDIRGLILERQRQSGATLVYVTHDLSDALSLADTLIVMKDGKIMQSGPVPELLEQPQTIDVARFLNSPPPNEFDGTATVSNRGLQIILADGQQFSMPAVGLGWPQPSESIKVIVTIGADEIRSWEPSSQQGILIKGNVLFIERGVRRSIVECMSQLGKIRFIAPGPNLFSRDERVELTFPAGSVSLFDASNGRRFV